MTLFVSFLVQLRRFAKLETRGHQLRNPRHFVGTLAVMAQAVRHVGVTEGYDAWAETYNADGNPLIAVEEACGAVQQLDVRGKVVADIGTGTGRHLVSLLERGAALAIGLDGSAGMLARAEMSVKQVHHVPASRSRLVQHDLLQTP